MTKPFLSEEMRYIYPLTPDSVVIDAGAYMGDSIQEWVARYGCRVIALEPIPEFYEATKARFAGNPKAKVLNYALSAYDGEIQIGLSNNSSGLYSTGETKVKVPAITLKTLMKKEGLDRVDLLKLNIEGSEYAVLEKALTDGLLPKIGVLQAQFHWCAPRAEDRYAAIRRSLLTTHDHTWGEDPTLWQSYSLKT